MRGVDCMVPNCGHLHADRDEQLAHEVVQHVREAHPEIELDLRAARTLVDRDAYEDAEHTGRKRGHWNEFADFVGRSDGPL